MNKFKKTHDAVGGVNILFGGEDGDIATAFGTQVFTQDGAEIGGITALKMDQTEVDNVLHIWIKVPILSVSRNDSPASAVIATKLMQGVEPVTE